MNPFIIISSLLLGGLATAVCGMVVACIHPCYYVGFVIGGIGAVMIVGGFIGFGVWCCI